MAHNFPMPDAMRLEHLITEIYEATPGPDMVHLNRIEERLSRKLKTRKHEAQVNKLPWWIVLLLAGGFAAAAWWAGEQWLGESEPMPVEYEVKPSDDVKENMQEPDESGREPKSDEQTEEQATNQDNNSPIIYQREQ